MKRFGVLFEEGWVTGFQETPEIFSKQPINMFLFKSADLAEDNITKWGTMKDRPYKIVQVDCTVVGTVKIVGDPAHDGPEYPEAA